ncbi:MAG: hypothetical protein IKE43_09765 [Coriobacteriales bacterium]|nr:hypothetical protein [Coriobacteriales bacterium]
MDTRLYITHKSALHFWRCYRIASLDPSKKLLSFNAFPAATNEAAQCAHTSREIQDLLDTLNLPFGLDLIKLFGSTLHIALASFEQKCRMQTVKTHVWPFTFTREAFYRLDNNVYIASPASCLAQLSRELSLPKTILLSMEFSGTYALDPNTRETHYQVQSILTAEGFRAFLNANPHSKSSKHMNALRASEYMICNSASRMETNLAMLLTLPYRYGGYGLPKPDMNVDLLNNNSSSSPQQHKRFKPDLYWPKYNLALEYNSHEFHVTPNTYEHDADRRDILEEMGITVIPVSKQKVYDPSLLDHLSHKIANIMGHRLKLPKDFMQKQDQLRQEILF